LLDDDGLTDDDVTLENIGRALEPDNAIGVTLSESMTTPDADGECPHCGLELPKQGPPMCPRCGAPR